MKTVLETLTIATEQFEHAGVDSPRLTAELLLAHVLRCKRIDLYLKFDQPIAPNEREAFGALYKRRLAREPLQYVLGFANFFGLDIEVNRDVLIPRPETEDLVVQILEQALPNAITPRIVDIGTGSGCIALALGRAMPTSTIEAIDVSPAALVVARRNAERSKIGNVTFRVADIFNEDALTGEYDIIVSNPPYVSAQEILETELEVREFEPRIATTDNADGLTFYRRLAAIAPQHLMLDGMIAVEVGFDQATEVARLFSERGLKTETKKDHAGIERVVMGWKRVS